MISSFLKTICIVSLFALVSFSVFAQTKEEKKAALEAQVKQMIESGEFLFAARNMNPMGGRTHIITSSNYGIIVSKDSVISDLPYIGRAYTAPIGSTSSGIKFTSVEFEIKTSPAKKGGWNISIKPKDISDIRELSLIITNTGNTTVNVLSNSRQSISYTGELVERKKN